MNGTHTTPSPILTEGLFNARAVVQTLENLMIAVTKDTVDAQTVNAACNCAARITDLLRVHLEAERLHIARKRTS